MASGNTPIRTSPIQYQLQRASSPMNVTKWNIKTYEIPEEQMSSMYHCDQYVGAKKRFYGGRRNMNRGIHTRSLYGDDGDDEFDCTLEENMLYADMLDADDKIYEMATEFNESLPIFHKQNVAEKTVRSLRKRFDSARKGMFIDKYEFIESLEKLKSASKTR